MSEFPITATYVESAEYHIERLKYFPRKKGLKVFYILWGLMFTLMGLNYLLKGDTRGVVSTAIVGGIMVLFILGLPHVWRWWFRYMIKKQLANQTHTVKWEFRDEDIQLYTSKVSTRYDWNYVTRVVQNPDGFLLFHDAYNFHWIPKSSFATSEDCERFAELLRRKVAIQVESGECKVQS